MPIVQGPEILHGVKVVDELVEEALKQCGGEVIGGSMNHSVVFKYTRRTENPNIQLDTVPNGWTPVTAWTLPSSARNALVVLLTHKGHKALLLGEKFRR